MSRKNREPTSGPRPPDGGPAPPDARPDPADGAAEEGGKPNRLTLPVIAGEPADWRTAVLTTLVRVHARVERRMTEVVGAHGMTLAQFDVLATLGSGEGIAQQELAERLLVTKGNVVGLIDRACRAGWVERRPDAADRRVNRLYLTDQGRERLRAARPGAAGLRADLLGGFSEDELRQLHRLLRRLGESAGA